MILFLKPRPASGLKRPWHDFVPEAGGVDPGQWKTNQDRTKCLNLVPFRAVATQPLWIGWAEILYCHKIVK